MIPYYQKMRKNRKYTYAEKNIVLQNKFISATRLEIRQWILLKIGTKKTSPFVERKSFLFYIMFSVFSLFLFSLSFLLS